MEFRFRWGKKKDFCFPWAKEDLSDLVGGWLHHRSSLNCFTSRSFPSVIVKRVAFSHSNRCYSKEHIGFVSWGSIVQCAQNVFYSSLEWSRKRFPEPKSAIDSIGHCLVSLWSTDAFDLDGRHEHSARPRPRTTKRPLWCLLPIFFEGLQGYNRTDSLRPTTAVI